MIIPKELESVLSADPEVMHGKLCFTGTRVPLTVFLDNLAEGVGAEEFAQEYPSVSLEQILRVVVWQQRETKQTLGLDLAS